jgi:tRNA A-37 threonylcarbamoyl transferase component Bud32
MILKNIDKEEKYGVYPENFEIIEKNDYENNTDVLKCFPNINDVFLKSIRNLNFDGNLRQITYPKISGKTLYDVVKILKEYNILNNKTLFINHLKAIKNLINGLYFYHKNNIYKSDNHDGNVIYTGTLENPIKYKFIDFGLSEDMTHYSDKKKNERKQYDIDMFLNCIFQFVKIQTK